MEKIKLPFTKEEWERMKKEEHEERMEILFGPTGKLIWVIFILFTLLMVTTLMWHKEWYENLPQDQKDYEDFLNEQKYDNPNI